MIREVSPREYDLVYEFLEKDIARNYFILLGLKSKKLVYKKIYGEYVGNQLKSILFQRKSRLLQFYAPGEFDLGGFVDLISRIQYTGLIGPRSYCEKFVGQGVFQSFKEGAYISKLGKASEIKDYESKYKTRKISVDDLDEIVELYRDIFSSFASKEIMEEKLISKRGRGICIEKDGEIISLAQSDFETKDGAVIVGIGTKKAYRYKGLATMCLKELSRELLEEGKNLYLQYDNLEAGKIYKRLGFKVTDQVIHLEK